MTYHPDMVIVDKNGQPTVLIELKLKLGTDKEWASRMRHNLFLHNDTPKSLFFWIALPDRFYIWKNKSWENVIDNELAFPDYVVDADPILKPYFEHTHISPETVVKSSFALLLDSWLYALSTIEGLPKRLREHNEWLVDSGLLETIRNGYTVLEPTI